jgi:hypothetical protein
VDRSELLSKAAEIISGERNERYGSAQENFGYIAEFWSIYLKTKIDPVDVVWMMILMKAARAINDKKYIDNYIDSAGYSALGGELIDDES